jgi:hypothetical protein
MFTLELEKRSANYIALALQPCLRVCTNKVGEMGRHFDGQRMRGLRFEISGTSNSQNRVNRPKERFG